MAKYKSLILSILIFALNSLACSHAGISMDDLKTLEERTFNISPNKNITVEASFGDVLITSWNKNEVYVKVLGNDKAAEKVKLYFDNSDNEVKVKAEYEKGSWNWSNRGMGLRFEIKVPEQFNTKIVTAGGNLRLANVDGNNSLKTSGGDIAIKYTRGLLKITTSGGNINLDDVEGDVNASTSGGDITANKFSGQFQLSTSGGNIDLTGSNAAIQASTSGGDISLHYTGENKGIKLNSSGGSVESDFAGNNAVKISSNKFEADINSGGKELLAKTSGGSVRIRK